MPDKLYSKQELADIYRKANPGFGFEEQSDDDVLKTAGQFPGGKEFLAKLAPEPPPAAPPVSPPTGFQKMRELSARVFKTVAPAVTPAARGYGLSTAAEAQARQLGLQGLTGVVPEPVKEAARAATGALGGQIKTVAADPFKAIFPPPEKLLAVNTALNVRPWVEEKITKPVMRTVAPVGMEAGQAGVLPEDQDIIGRTAMETLNELIPMSPIEAAGWIVGPKATEAGIKAGLLGLSKVAPKTALKMVSPIMDLGDVDTLFSRVKSAVERKTGFRIPDSNWEPLQDDMARAILKRKMGISLKQVTPRQAEPQAPAGKPITLAEIKAEAAGIKGGMEKAPAEPPYIPEGVKPPGAPRTLEKIKTEVKEIKAGLGDILTPGTLGKLPMEAEEGTGALKLTPKPVVQEVGKNLWDMPLAELQGKITKEGLKPPAWKTSAEVMEDTTKYPNGEAWRKWAAEEEIYNRRLRHRVPDEIITKYNLENNVVEAINDDIIDKEALIEEYTAGRGGVAPFWGLAKKMGFVNKAKLLKYLEVEMGQDWKGHEFPEELAWVVRKNGTAGIEDMTQAAYQAGLIPESDPTLFIEGLEQDWKFKNSGTTGIDITEVIPKRNMTQYGSEYLSKKPGPRTDLPGQIFIPGTGPEMSTVKIRPENFIDDETFLAGFEAEAETPGLFDVVKDAEAVIIEIKKIERAPGGEAAVTAPELDKIEANFQPVTIDKTFKLWRATEQLIEKYAQRFGEDNYIPRGAVGIFYRDTKNIFLQAANNVYVAVHEIVHFVDEKTNWFKTIMRVTGTVEGGKLLYDPATLPVRRLLSRFYLETYHGASMTQPLKKRVKEGVAMLIQKAVESPQLLETPEWRPLADMILKPGGKYYSKTFEDLVKDGREFMGQYYALDANKKIGARVTDGGRRRNAETLFSGWDRVQEVWFDELHKFLRLSEITGEQWGPNDPYTAMQAYRYWGSIANANLDPKQGIWVLLGNNVVKAGEFNIGYLFKLIGSLDNVERFNNWLIARRVRAGYREMEAIRQRVIGYTGGAYDIANPTAGGLRTWMEQQQKTMFPEDFALIVATIKIESTEYAKIAKIAVNDNIGKEVAEQAYQDGFRDFPAEQWAKIHDDINSVILDVLQDAGFLTPERYRRLKANPDYASFRRDILTLVQDGGAHEVPTGFNISSLKERKGSEKAFKGPLYGQLENFFEAVRKGMIQKAINKVYAMVKKNQEMLGSAFQIQRLITTPRFGGGFEYPQLKDPNILMARQAGKYKPLVVLDKSLKTVIENALLDPHAADTAEKILTTVSGLFVKGTTSLYPLFAVANITRDTITAFAQTQTNYIPFYEQIKALIKLASKDDSEIGELIQRYMVITGGRQTLAHMFDQDRTPEQAYRWLTSETTKIETALNVAEKLGDIVSTPSKVSEDFTRCMEYVNAKMAGMDDLAALEMAGQITAPFHHQGTIGGKVGRVIVKSVPYFKANLQVLSQQIKTTVNPKTRGRMIFTMAAMAAATIGSTYAIKSASKRQRQNLHGMNEGLREGFIWYPMPGEAAREKGRLGKIAVPQGYAFVGNIINMAILEYTKEDNFSGSEYFQASTALLPDQMSPSQGVRVVFTWMPWIIQPILGVATGKKNYPNIMELTPKTLQELPRAEQYTEYTSAPAKWLAGNIGKALNLNPIEIDYLIEGYLGRTSRFFTGRMGSRNFSNVIYSDVYLGSMRDLEFYYKLREAIAEQQNMYKREALDLAAAAGRKLDIEQDADIGTIAEAAAKGKIGPIKPSPEFQKLLKFKPRVTKIADELQHYRWVSRIKNRGPATEAELGEVRDSILDDINLLRQAYEKKP